MTIRTVAQVVDAYEQGRHWFGMLRRAGPSFTLGTWIDMSYAAGIPVANYYASTPLVSAQLAPTDGISHGSSVNAYGHRKYLHKALVIPPATSVGLVTMHFHDVVAYYPFVDGDGGSQDTINVLGTLRYSGGRQCKIMLISQGAGIADAVDATLTYTNQDGVQRTLSPVYIRNTATAGQLCSNAVDAAALGVLAYNIGNPYLALHPQDSAIRSIDSINLPTAVSGIFAAAIVRPLATISYQELTTPIEVDFMRDRLRMPEIEDGAYIHCVARGTVTAAPTTMHAQLDFIWG